MKKVYKVNRISNEFQFTSREDAEKAYVEYLYETVFKLHLTGRDRADAIQEANWYNENGHLIDDDCIEEKDALEETDFLNSAVEKGLISPAQWNEGDYDFFALEEKMGILLYERAQYI